MAKSSQPSVTDLLQAWSDGDRSALDQLAPLVYQELHRRARQHMARERPDHTLQATALINEVYLRLIGVNRMRWQNRAHFFAVSANMMRRILVEFARRRHRHKRGGEAQRVVLDEAVSISTASETDLVALDQALTRLAVLDPRLSQVVELRYFGGLTMEEIAEVINVSPKTVQRDWKTAKVWLLREIHMAGRDAT